MARMTANIKQWIIVGTSVFIVILCNVSIASTGQNINQLQKKLIELRIDVDEKSDELTLLRQENKQQRKFLLNQVAELEATIEHKTRIVSKIDNKLAKNRKLIETTKDTDTLARSLEAAIDEISIYVSSSLPFKRKSRLDALDEIRQQLKDQSVSASRLANKLWAFVEDEMMLSKGNGVYRQIISMDNEEKLVDVARVGMMMLYFRDGSGNVGMAKKKNNERDKWEFVALNKKTQIHQIHYLFDAFQKQIRFGEFSLPNSLSGTVIKRGLNNEN